MDKGIYVIDTGYYVPENVLTNDDLSKIVDTSDEWIYPPHWYQETSYM